MNLRVITWNLWWRFGPWESRENAIAQVLVDCNADVCCLQEVWTDSADSLAKRLAGRLEMHSFSSTRRLLRSFNVALSRRMLVLALLFFRGGRS